MYPFRLGPPRIEQYREYPSHPWGDFIGTVLSLASEIVSPMHKEKLYG